MTSTLLNDDRERLSNSIFQRIPSAVSRRVEVCVPASTANLGAGFDCCGLALRLYLKVRARVGDAANGACRVRTRGATRSDALPGGEENLIYRAMRFVAEREGFILPAVRLAVRNDIPLASGLGSSGAAIVAGVVLCTALCDATLPIETLLRHVTAFEGHADNVAASLYGGWVVNCMMPNGDVHAIKRCWSPDVKVVVVTPHLPLETDKARAALPASVQLKEAVHNLQRATLFNAAMETRRYDLLWEAMQDKLHQPYRQTLVPGLTEALATPQMPGLLGIALSGAGPSVLALAQHNFLEIGSAVARSFHDKSVSTTVRLLEVDTQGVSVQEK